MEENIKELEGLNIFNLYKPVELKETIGLIKDRIINGEVDECRAGIVLKRMAKLSEEVLKDKDVKEAILDETLKNLENGKMTSIFNAKVSHAPTYTFFKFDECDDPYWEALRDIEVSIKLLKKDRESELKLLIPTKSNLTQFGVTETSKDFIIESLPVLKWEDNGEVVTIKPPIKGQKMGIKYNKL